MTKKKENLTQRALKVRDFKKKRSAVSKNFIKYLFYCSQIVNKTTDETELSNPKVQFVKNFESVVQQLNKQELKIAEVFFTNKRKRRDIKLSSSNLYIHLGRVINKFIYFMELAGIDSPTPHKED